MNASAAFRPSGSVNIATALQPYAGPWNRRLAAHLLRRAAFGGSPDDVTRFAGMSANAAVEALVNFPPTPSLSEAPNDLEDPYAGFRKKAMQRAMERGMQPRMRPDMQPGMQEMQSQNGEAALARQKAAGMVRRRTNLALTTWWLERMLKTPAPLQEKMTLFWHGHFASAANAKGITPREAVAQNWLFRSNALGNVRELTQAVSKDAAMLRYLDNFRSGKAHPNENYARELMELFTLGIGNYTEADVRESARAFTGWTIIPRSGEFVFNGAQHDDGRKTFLGRSGNFNGNDIVDIIFQQPAAGRWFAQKLLNFFVYNDPEPELVNAVAGLLRKTDFNAHAVVSTLLRSNVFYSDRAYRSLVKSPVEFVIGSYQLYGVPAIAPETVGALNRMGQIPFHPPSVKGWDGGATWLNSQTLLTRENFSSALMGSKHMMDAGSWLTASLPANASDAVKRLVGTILQGDASPASAARIEAYLNGSDTSALGTFSGENFEERIRGAAYLTMAMPAYQLN